ncbi:MAG: hypothetical protein ICV64_05810 [Thermoleophilia bacterium]|nr:hypothetical protein [Thermoleophilia bacterium]
MVRGDAAWPARTLVAIRLAFWVGAALTLLWQPARQNREWRDLGLPVFQAYDPFTDLLFNTFSHWDSGWYLSIAEYGYADNETVAFFPLYPLTVRAVAVVTRSPLVAGVLVSLAAAAVAAVVLARLARPLLGDRGARDSVLYLALFPVSLVFTAVYSEGLFLALSAGAFLAAVQRRGLLTGVLAALAVATRSLGLALVPALLVLLWPRSRSPRELLRPLLLVLAPLPLGLFALYLHHRFGDATAFVDAQRGWGRETPTLGPAEGLFDAIRAAYHGLAQLVLHLPRGAEGAVTRSDQVAIWHITHLLFLAVAIWLTWIAWQRLGPAYGLYSATVLAFVLATPADWFPLLSLPRFLLADFPLFLALAAVTEGRPRAREAVLVSFAAVGAVAAAGFARHAWVA